MCLIIDRLILSRLERLYALAPSLPNLPRAVKIGRYRAQWARLCALFRSAIAALHKSHRLALTPASALLQLYCLVKVCARAGETVYLPLDPQCVRLLPRPTGLPPMAFAVSFRIRFAEAKTAVKHHRPTHIRPLGPHHKCTLISRPTAVPEAYIFVAK